MPKARHKNVRQFANWILRRPLAWVDWWRSRLDEALNPPTYHYGQQL